MKYRRRKEGIKVVAKPVVCWGIWGAYVRTCIEHVSPFIGLGGGKGTNPFLASLAFHFKSAQLCKPHVVISNKKITAVAYQCQGNKVKIGNMLADAQ